jgi:hypothetical protein
VERGRDPPNADDLALPCRQVVGEILIVPVAVGIRHQHFDVLADDLGLRISEHLLGRGAEGKDQSTFVDHHHRVGNGGEDRPQVRLGLGRALGGRLVHGDVHSNAHGQWQSLWFARA